MDKTAHIATILQSNPLQCEKLLCRYYVSQCKECETVITDGRERQWKWYTLCPEHHAVIVRCVVEPEHLIYMRERLIALEARISLIEQHEELFQRIEKGATFCREQQDETLRERGKAKLIRLKAEVHESLRHLTLHDGAISALTEEKAQATLSRDYYKGRIAQVTEALPKVVEIIGQSLDGLETARRVKQKLGG